MKTFAPVLVFAGLLASACTASAETAPPLAEPAKANVSQAYYANTASKMIVLDTEEGRALLDPASPDYEPLRSHWEPQLKSHCGACSAVIVANSLVPGAGHTQNSIFNERTAHIITQDVVYKQGFTLEELHKTILAATGLRAERFHAGAAEGEFGYEDFVSALKANRANPQSRIICLFSRGWLRERKNLNGHFCPVADYNEAENKVLLLEVSQGRHSFWVDAKELWEAMNQVDKVCDRVRGWIVVSRE